MDIKMAAEIIGMDYNQTLDRFSGNEKMLKKYIKLFPADENFTNLEIAIAAENIKGIETASHTLKGLAGNLGFMNIYEISAQICNAAREEKLDIIPELFSQLTVQYRITVEVLLLVD